jgi:S1-C subfamily serine protease
MGEGKMGKKATLIVFALLVAVSAWGLVAAQDDTNVGAPFLGIGLGEADNGVVVTDVAPDSPAAAAGLKVDDLITAINGDDVTADSIREAIANLSVGDEITLSVERGDETLELNATLAERPEVQPAQPPMLEIPGLRPMLGVRLEDTDNGVVVREVVANSPAENAGLQVDDVIVKINDTDIAKASEAVDAIRALAVGDTVSIEVQRGDATETLEATLEGTPLPMVQEIPFGRDFQGLGVQFNRDDQTWTIRNLSEDSDLYTAGLREGDVIQQFNGSAYDPAGLREYLNDIEDDLELTLTIERDGATQDISVPSISLKAINAFEMGGNGFQFLDPNGQGFNIPFGMGQMMTGGRLGVQFVTLDEQTATEHNTTLTDGALVTEVVDASPASEAGLQVNDVITSVNDEPVDAEHTLRDRLTAYEPEDVVTLAVSRGDENLTIEVTLGEQERFDMMPFFGPDGEQFHFEPPQPGQFEQVQPQANL